MKNPPHPGELIKGYLEQEEMEIEDIGFAQYNWQAVIEGREDLTKEMCEILEVRFGPSRRWWWQTQIEYDDNKVSDEELWS